MCSSDLVIIQNFVQRDSIVLSPELSAGGTVGRGQRSREMSGEPVCMHGNDIGW